MSFTFADLNLTLSEWSINHPLNATAKDPIIDRIRQVLVSIKSGALAHKWHGDLQPLIRQCLLQEADRAGQIVNLRVPANVNWPSDRNWHEHGVDTVDIADGTAYILKAKNWFPEWLDCSEDGMFHDAFTNHIVRNHAECTTDPFLEDATGYQFYSSPGQRDALRAAFFLKPGHTLIVNLPTGSGKSLVGQAPALVRREDGPLTIVVVPTVALVLDQETAMLKYLHRAYGNGQNRRLAWVSDISSEERAEIRSRIRNGTQRILITSPEALSTSLLSVITEITKNGMLAYFVIDEAHLVAQWGVDFRPLFQALTGLRNNLLKIAPTPFRTLLLSATLTEDTVETLAHLFGPPEFVHMVSAVHLRPEPQYWVFKARSRTEKESCVLQALRHAPRPFILYATKREDVRKWTEVLRQKVGLSRLASFDGDTDGKLRDNIIKQWRANTLDGIVATSAFGVGVDKADVRTIIHAAIPETLDRFYQEVGRGGRDGRSSVSLLVYDDSDWDLPRRLSQPKVVTEEIGFSRWEAMYASRQRTTEEGLWQIDIDARRDELKAGNEYNVNWNVRTLTLMARAGLLTLEMDPNENEMNEDIDRSNSILAEMARFRVRILHDGHRIKKIWEQHVATARDKTKAAGDTNLKLMHRLIQGDEEVASILAELYRVRSLRWPVQVVRACGGCKQHRDSDVLRHYPSPIPIPLAETAQPDVQAWERIFPWLNPAFVYVFYESDTPVAANTIVRFVSWLVSNCGVREVAVDPGSAVIRHSDWHNLYKQSSDSVVVHRQLSDFDSEPYTPLARVSIMPPDVNRDMFDAVHLLQRPYHFVLLPRNFPDPVNTLRQLIDVSKNGVLLEQLVREISK